MTKLAYVVKKNLKFELLPHFLIAVLLILVIPVMFGLNDLDRQMAAFPLERIVILVGIVVMIPIFWPEQDRTVFDIMYTKQTPPAFIYAVRSAYSAVVVFLIPAVFIGIMYLLNSEVTMPHYMGTVSSAVFLGGLGAMTFAVTNNIAAAYMLPVICYVVCMASESFGVFDVMMMSHGTFNGKLYQMAVGIVLTAAAVCIRSSRRRIEIFG